MAAGALWGYPPVSPAVCLASISSRGTVRFLPSFAGELDGCASSFDSGTDDCLIGSVSRVRDRCVRRAAGGSAVRYGHELACDRLPARS